MTSQGFWIPIFAALLAGCGAGKVPPTQYYKLDIPPAPASAGPSAPVSVRVEPFRTAAFLRQDRIVYRPSPVEVGYYEYHRWAEPPNDTVTKAVADQLTRRHVFQSVEVSQGPENSDYVLRGTVDRLQEVDYQGVVRAQVSISAQLEDPAQRQVVWSGAATSESSVTQGDVQAVVAAMGQASQQSIARLLADMTKFVQVNHLARASSGASAPR
jgi:ABC-type uncharacterized transport system auxiliary subunit